MTPKGVSVVSEIDVAGSQSDSRRTKVMIVVLATACVVLGLWWRSVGGEIKYHFANTTELAQYCEHNGYFSMPVPSDAGIGDNSVVSVGKADVKYFVFARPVVLDGRISDEGTFILRDQGMASGDMPVVRRWVGKYRVGGVGMTPTPVSRDVDTDVTIDLDTGKVEVGKGAR